MLKITKLLTVAGAALGFALATSSTASATVSLPTANCGLGSTNNCLIFGDFTVYSLALLNFQAGYSNVGPGDPYYVSSNGNDIANAIVIGSSNANAINNQDIGSIAGSVDNAYNTPNGTKQATNFLMVPPDPIASFSGDNAAQSNTLINNLSTANASFGTNFTSHQGNLPLWDITTSALIKYLNGGPLTFFFNLNQTNHASTYLNSPQDMLAYAQVIFTNTSTGAQKVFYFDGNSCGGIPGSCIPGVQSYAQTANVDDILPTAADQWGYIHGQICVSNAGAVLGFGACDSSNPAEVGGNTVNQNLGANNAAFALYSQGVEDALLSGDYNIMSVDLRMAAEDNGYEQLFIEAGNAINTPEPATIGLFGAGLALLGFWGHRRRKRTQA